MEKRHRELQDIKVLLIDIEGTISSLFFVKNVLFPYSVEKLNEYIEMGLSKIKKAGAQISDPLSKVVINLFSTLKERESIDKNLCVESGENSKILCEKLVTFCKKIIESDEKLPALKELQGIIWKRGYEEGVFVSPLYEDVLPVLREQLKLGRKIYIYSSGSRQAQDLFFHYSCEGDIRPLFSGFFDTEIGSKIEKKSYLKIAKEISCEPNSVLFLSDNPNELVAAAEGGLEVRQVVREGVEPHAEIKQVRSFKELF